MSGQENTPEKREYLAFMQWFQNAHPDSYVLYWQSIAMAKNGSGITVNNGNITNEIIDHLTSILSEYYVYINS